MPLKYLLKRISMQFETRDDISKQLVAVLSHLMDNSAEGGLTQLWELVTVTSLHLYTIC